VGKNYRVVLFPRTVSGGGEALLSSWGSIHFWDLMSRVVVLLRSRIKRISNCGLPFMKQNASQKFLGFQREKAEFLLRSIWP